MDGETLLELYRRMSLIRSFEEAVSELYAKGEIPGFVHLSIGQEAAAVGACWPLAAPDIITSTHRGHGHCIAKGLSPERMLAELMARESGTNHGRGGSMHIADPDLGIFGANGIVAAGVPIAGGAATASRLRDDGTVVVAFFGDGAIAQGAFHEAANLAALWRLPLVLFCENNHFAEFSPSEMQHPVPIEERAKAYGVPYVGVDGNNVEDVATAMEEVVGNVRNDGGPVLVEAETYRWHGHYEGDPERYREPDELERWQQERDPLVIARSRAEQAGIAGDRITEVDEEIASRIERAIEEARTASEPDPATLERFVLRPRPTWDEGPVHDTRGEDFRVMDAVRLALEHELETDPEVFVAGVDVGAGGNVFGLTRGLHDRWPERVRDTPISETAVVGLAVGAAMAGMRPVVELMYLDFIGVCFDQLLNQAAKLPFMTGGRARMALTVRTQFGAGRSSGSQHSQSLEALLAHVPGLTVVMPSTPADTYGLLRAAIRDPNPVVFIENRLLYGRKGPQPPPDHVVPIGAARVVREGSDVTVVSMSRMLHEVLAAAEDLTDDGIDAEVIDLRSISPLDHDTILGSVRKTSRIVVAHEAVTDFGVGAEIAATVADDGFWHLDAPIRRVGARFMPAPYAPSLEQHWLPDRERVATVVRDTVAI